VQYWQTFITNNYYCNTRGKNEEKAAEVEYSFDFELIGIISSAKGYKLAWEVNNILGSHLIRQPDLTILLTKDSYASYVYYAFENEVNVLKLFRNKPNEADLIKNLLVPEFPHYDYILLTQGEAHMASKRLQELLKNIPSIELTAFIPLTALKSKDNFIF
jgi:hypothetical protein